jgi:hypothetical protein
MLICATLQAASFTFTLGSQAPSFTDGQTPIGVATYNTAVAGNAAPFNGFIGSDVAGPNFSASWSYSYLPIADTIASATLSLGLYDADTGATGNQVASFTLSGTDLTASLNASFESLHGGTGAANAEYDVMTVNLPASTFAALRTGTLTLALSLQAPGLGVLGAAPFNGAGLDFSTLTINTQAAVPEPGTCALLALGAATLGWAKRRR